MTLIQCPRCRRIIPVPNHSGDFVHDCDSGDDTIDNEDIVKLDNPNWFRQGIGNKASVKARVQRVDVDDVNKRGNRTATVRTRQHQEYINLQDRNI